MEGRRVNRRAPRRNPLYTLFLCLLAAVFVLMVVSIVLGVKLGAAHRELEKAQTQLEELQASAKQDDLPDSPDGQDEPQLSEEQDSEKLDGEDTPAADPSAKREPTAAESSKVGWLDLSGHDEVQVKPEKVFSSYATYYANAGVNLRGGPGTGYNKVQLLDKGTQVKGAAKSGEWTFVAVGGKFGWIKSEYLSTTPPLEATSGSLKTN